MCVTTPSRTMDRTILFQFAVFACTFLGCAVGIDEGDISRNIDETPDDSSMTTVEEIFDIFGIDTGDIYSNFDVTTPDDSSASTAQEIFDILVKQPEEPCPNKWHECRGRRRCIPPQWVCDGYPDCAGDGEDDEDLDKCDKTVCAATEMKCKNRKCVPNQFICDNKDDCGDGSDQIVCDPFKCHPVTIQCPAGKCIPYSSLCNGNNDCLDYSDEKFCDKNNCHPSAFQCLNGECISRLYFCRTISGDQCGDSSNLKYCNKTSSEICPSGWFECASRTRCVPSQWKCDRLPDCPDASDEENCGSSSNVPMKLSNDTDESEQKEILETIAQIKCDREEFKCKSGKCLPIHWMCDGERDICEDGSYLQICKPFSCHPAFYQCLNGKCVSMASVCNERDDCGDNSDEQVCSPHFCHPSAFQCLNKNCINRRNFCDQYAGDKCGDNSNQLFCRKRKTDPCPSDWFECADGARCIPSQWVCDGKSDCLDDSEELNCGRNNSSDIATAKVTTSVKSSDTVGLRSWIWGEEISEQKTSQKGFVKGEEVLIVRFTVWMGDEKNLEGSWQLEIPVNSTLFEAIETVKKMDNRQKVEYMLVDGKPYVIMFNRRGDSPHSGMYWYIYSKPLLSEEEPNVVKQSPVDVMLSHDQEIILWYKHAPWNSHSWVRYDD